MAAVSDCFSLGSIVWCRTCYNQEMEGEVLAFDPQTKVLILKCPSTSGVSGFNDVHFINLSMVSELQVKKEVNNTMEAPQSLNLQRLNTRIKQQVDEKRRLLTAMSPNVTPEAQRLFITIAKTIKEVRWRNSDIIVWDNVTITPPYQLEDVKDIRGSDKNPEVTYLKKVVEKHIKDSGLSSKMQHNTNSQ